MKHPAIHQFPSLSGPTDTSPTTTALSSLTTTFPIASATIVHYNTFFCKVRASASRVLDVLLTLCSLTHPSHSFQHPSKMADIFSRLNASPGASILAYCISSISMTLVNKYVVSGQSWNLNFLYLAIQVSPLPSPSLILCLTCPSPWYAQQPSLSANASVSSVTSPALTGSRRSDVCPHFPFLFELVNRC